MNCSGCWVDTPSHSGSNKQASDTQQYCHTAVAFAKIVSLLYSSRWYGCGLGLRDTKSPSLYLRLIIKSSRKAVPPTCVRRGVRRECVQNTEGLACSCCRRPLSCAVSTQLLAYWRGKPIRSSRGVPRVTDTTRGSSVVAPAVPLYRRGVSEQMLGFRTVH